MNVCFTNSNMSVNAGYARKCGEITYLDGGTVEINLIIHWVVWRSRWALKTLKGGLWALLILRHLRLPADEQPFGH